MIRRADFAAQDLDYTMGLFSNFSISNLDDTSPVLTLLRKPDFQRETNHWSPDQIVTFIKSFLDNQLIPALILWKSPSHIFVIDGGHRLSALRAWMKDDYGDGAISLEFYNGEISDEQKKIAKRTRLLVDRTVGRYTTLKDKVGSTTAAPEEIKRAGNLFTRALDLQWVQGNADVAETSFFNINSQGTPLDDIESALIKNRKKPVAIASRAILRAGTGHKYWSHFPAPRQHEIEELATEFHELLFDPEAEIPIRTLELPLGGSVSPVNALQLLIDFLAIASSPQNGSRTISSGNDDDIGNDTIEVLILAKEVALRIVGNGSASLGLHPAVYFYNDRGSYSRHFFLGIVRLITEKVRNNDGAFFKKFTKVRGKLEDFLITNKSLINQAFANVNRDARVVRVRDMMISLIDRIAKGETVNVEDLFASIGLTGRILDLQKVVTQTSVSNDTKSAVFIKTALQNASKCPLCDGLLFPTKSVSYDHKVRVRDGGKGERENVQMTHPFCNSAIKN
jgi:hypothetical protein